MAIPDRIIDRVADQMPDLPAEASGPPSVGPDAGPYLRRNGNGTVDYHERIALASRHETATGHDAQPTAAARRANLLLAALQVVVGYQWLVSGVDKLLYGQFPDSMGQLVSRAASSDRLPVVFARFLRDVVLPNATHFGLLVEFGETLAGLGLLAGAVLTLAHPLIERRLGTADGSGARFMRVALRAMSVLVAGAALGALVMGLNYYLLDGMPTPWFTPGLAYGGALHPALFLALACLLVLIGQVASQRTLGRQQPRDHHTRTSGAGGDRQPC